LPDLFSAANYRFDQNTYRLRDLRGAYWARNGQTLTWSQWTALGHDRNGRVEVT
jgi:hypothetical protein